MVMDFPGRLLVRKGLLTEERLLEALKLQKRIDLPIEQVLIENNFLREDELVRVFRKDMMFPEIMRHDLEEITPDIRDIIPAETAVKFRIVPVRLDLHGHLVLAMANPADNRAADELVRQTRLYVVRCVAAKSLIDEFLDKLYGDDSEEIVLLTKIIHPSPTIRPDIDGKTIDEHVNLEGDEESEERAAEEVISLTRVKKKAVPDNDWKEKSDSETLERFAFSVSKPVEKPAMKTRTGRNKKFAKTPTLRGIPAVAIEPKPVEARKKAGIPTLSLKIERSKGFESALQALEQVSAKNDVGKILCDYMNLFCKGVAFFVIRKGFLNGRGMRGSLNRKASIRQLHLPLNENSTLKETVDSRIPYRGAPGKKGSDRLLHDTLGYVPDKIVVFPVCLSDRVVALLYGDRIGPDFDSQELNELLIYAERTYERLLLAKKNLH